MKAGQFAQIILFRKLINFQNVVVIEEKLILFLHETVMHYINTEDQKVSYKFLYNLFFYKLRILCEYLDDALIKS